MNSLNGDTHINDLCYVDELFISGQVFDVMRSSQDPEVFGVSTTRVDSISRNKLHETSLNKCRRASCTRHSVQHVPTDFSRPHIATVPTHNFG